MPVGVYERTKEHMRKLHEGLYLFRKLNPHFASNKLFWKKGKEHPAYKNGKGKGYDYRNVIKSISLLGENCQLCNATKKVYTHHIDGNPRNNPQDGSNWQRLCVSCHMKLHWKPKRKFKNLKECREYHRNLDKLKRKNKLKEILKKRNIPHNVGKSKEICKILNISRERLRQLRINNRIKSFKIGGLYLYPKNLQRKYITRKYVLIYN
jgi:hypothetical protein